MYVCMYVCIYVWRLATPVMYVCMYVGRYVCMYVCVVCLESGSVEASNACNVVYVCCVFYEYIKPRMHENGKNE